MYQEIIHQICENTHIVRYYDFVARRNYGMVLLLYHVLQPSSKLLISYLLSFESNGIRWTGKVEMKGSPCCSACWDVD